MALRWIEGFETYGSSGTSVSGTSTSQLNLKWSGANTTGLTTLTIQSGRSSGLCLKQPGNIAGAQLQTRTFTSQATWTVGAAWYLDGLPSSSKALILIRDASTIQVGIYLNADGSLTAWRGNQAASLGSTAASVFAASAWQYVEVQTTIDGSAGVVTIKINGSQVLALTSQNTKQSGNASANSVAFFAVQHGTSSNYTYLDDIYVLDSSGSNNTTFLNQPIVEAITPSGAGNSTQWSPDSGSNYARVNETPEDGDTSYVTDSTSGHLDEYAYSDLSRIAGAIYGVQINTVGRLTDASSFSVIPVVRSSSSDYTQSTWALSGTSYANNPQIVEQDPATSAAWTASGVNAAQFGLQIA